MSTPFATLLDERGANGRLDMQPKWHSYAPRIGMLLLLRSASNLSRALSLCDPAPEALAIRKSRDCLHHSLKEASFWASALAAASLRFRARATHGDGVGEGLDKADTSNLDSIASTGTATPTNIPAIASNIGSASFLLEASPCPLRLASGITPNPTIITRPRVGKGSHLTNKDRELLSLYLSINNVTHHVLRSFDGVGCSLGQLVDQLVAAPHVFGEESAVAAGHVANTRLRNVGRDPHHLSSRLARIQGLKK